MLAVRNCTAGRGQIWKANEAIWHLRCSVCSAVPARRGNQNMNPRLKKTFVNYSYIIVKELLADTHQLGHIELFKVRHWSLFRQKMSFNEWLTFLTMSVNGGLWWTIIGWKVCYSPFILGLNLAKLMSVLQKSPKNLIDRLFFNLGHVGAQNNFARRRFLSRQFFPANFLFANLPDWLPL